MDFVSTTNYILRMNGNVNSTSPEIRKIKPITNYSAKTGNVAFDHVLDKFLSTWFKVFFLFLLTVKGHRREVLEIYFFRRLFFFFFFTRVKL